MIPANNINVYSYFQIHRSHIIHLRDHKPINKKSWLETSVLIILSSIEELKQLNNKFGNVDKRNEN